MIDFIRSTTQEAGSIVIKSSRSVVREKERGGNVVLRADLESEKYILNSIHNTYPNHVILSEETYSQLQNPEQQEHLWIIDPLDGTTNASYNIPFYAVSVAYVQQGVVKAGGIFDPNRHEFFWAEKGSGAFCNGERIKVVDKKELNGLIVNIGSPYGEENFQLTYPLGQNFHQQGIRIVNFGSSVLECAWVACGRLGAYLEAGLKPWDIAAANLILSEAGGIMIDPYKKEKPFSIFNQQAILVGNTFITNQLEKQIK